ncbi:benzoate 4-monooxygenase cytochrome P450 [Poronia punctata]|nr:benzoate 4-monooxygenase cytochrome P450 [Poronia punctata]
MDLPVFLQNEVIWIYLAVLLVSGTLIGTVVNIIYNLYFHPLAKIPGPKLAAVSNVPYSYWFLKGRQPFNILELHLKYGPVVRVAPNEVSFNTAGSWRDIYDGRQMNKTFVKSDFYAGGNFAARGVCGILNERQPEAHATQRRLLSPVFSDRALTEQEGVIAQNVEEFLAKLPNRQGDFDIAAGFERLASNIMGGLAFGESLHAVGNPDPYEQVAAMADALKLDRIINVMKRFPAVDRILRIVLHYPIKIFTADVRSNEDTTMKLIEGRIKCASPHRDFLTRLLEGRNEKRNKKKQPSALQLAAHAHDLVIAGSDTTATALAAITYHLLRDKSTMRTLQAEIRTAFASGDDITGKAAKCLPYLDAVILEGLRIYPPFPLAPPRVVPAGGEVVDGCFLPGGTIVSTSPYAASMDPANFKNPARFLPERWLREEPEDKLDASQPFSLGSRSCIGKGLAMLELRLTLAKLIWRFDLNLVNESMDWHRDSHMHTLWQKPKMFVKATDRNA